MTKAKTLEEILSDRGVFTEKEAVAVKNAAQRNAKKYWGGKRNGAGRKPQGKESLKVHMRVTESEKASILAARHYGITVKPAEVKFLHFAREQKLSLKSMTQMSQC